MTPHCKRCGAPVLHALTATGCVITLDPQISMLGSWRLRRGPDGDAFAIRDAEGAGERYTRHDGGTCSGVRAAGEQYR